MIVRKDKKDNENGSPELSCRDHWQELFGALSSLIGEIRSPFLLLRSFRPIRHMSAKKNISKGKRENARGRGRVDKKEEERRKKRKKREKEKK